MKLHLSVILLASVLYLPGCALRSSNALNTASSSPTSATSTGSASTSEQTPASVTSNWYTYTSPNGSYTALFPAKPQETVRSRNTKVGNINLKLVTYENRQKNIAYLTSDIKYGKEIPAGKAYKMLDDAKNGALKSGNKTLINEKKITLNGYSGIEFTTHSKKENIYNRIKIFFDPKNSTLYQVWVGGQEADINSQEATAFLDSLTIKS